MRLPSFVLAPLVPGHRRLTRVEDGVGDAVDIVAVRAQHPLVVRAGGEDAATKALPVAFDTALVPLLLSLLMVCDCRGFPRVQVDVKELRRKRLKALDEPRVVHEAGNGLRRQARLKDAPPSLFI
eukprot:scaffold54568_cov59-Phaeocystis_antarctica.AAC.3